MSLRFFKTALAALAAGAFFWLALWWPGDVPRIHTLQGATMGTSWQVQVVADAADDRLARTGAELKTLLAHLDREVFSTWTEGSELSQLNRGMAGVPRKLSPELLEVLLLAKQIHADSLQAFDISIAPLVDLWGFGPAEVRGVPASAEIAAAKARLGLAELLIDEKSATATRPARLALDLSAIAKGYAVDKLAEQLLGAGYRDFLVEIGGEIRLQGLRPDQTPWIVAIEAPASGSRAVHARISSAGQPLALAGSGDYRNFREVDGQRFSHEIDPRTGYPVTHALAAVTVIADSAAAADAWATALMVLGPREGFALATARNLAAYFIMHAPAGLESRSTAAFDAFLYEEPRNR